MKKILLSIAAIFVGLTLMTAPVHAECIRTSILGGSVCDKDGNKVDGEKPDGKNYFSCSCDDSGDGDGIKHILKFVAGIFTVSIGVLGVVGLGVSGVQYLTAGGNEEKTRKAKRRIFEIVIGLVVYAVAYALMSFLIPDFKPFN